MNKINTESGKVFSTRIFKAKCINIDRCTILSIFLKEAISLIT